MSSSPETSTHTTGAHRAHGAARKRAAAPRGASPHTLVQRPPARYEPYLDGLFTYCLSVLCDHDAATAALGDALALAERRGPRGPESAGDRRAWLYALARWSCLRKLTEARRKRQAAHASGRQAPHRSDPQSGAEGPRGEAALTRAHKAAADRRAAEALSATPVSEEAQDDRRRQLSLLAWPEAAGTTPEQREALELAVRHQLAAHEVAAVLGMDLAAARELLASAACEVERTRAALAVVETGACPGVARLTGDSRLVLSTTLRGELVRHVDDCPRCRRTAERAVPGAWPGTSVTPAALPVLEAPHAALRVAMAHAPRARGSAPRFDRRGFPMDPKDHAARRDRIRARAVTTTIVATVVAAPVLALWAAYRGAPLTGEGVGGRPASTSEAQDSEGLDGGQAGGYENAGNASAGPGSHATGGSRSPDVSVEVVSARGSTPGHLAVTAGTSGDTTLVTLTASGSSPVQWSARTGASWLYLSRSSGTLEPGGSVTVKVYVDHLREPVGGWTARVAIAPAGAVVTIAGYGTAGSPRPGGHPDPTATGPSPSGSGSTAAPTTTPTGPDPSPTDPTPTPTDTDPSSSDPGGSSPPPDASDDPDGS
ncbi:MULTISPECIES: BACON domain-containing protein [unclassified Streptomyces]|jgi:DNA-directed RNA polymerase specialized sigma subunit, sigma24 homolog|uniref:BACON domain-containing protein n=1 Tax=unclassified Streptomyces TaxID=2593676 RepID=UPI002E26B452